MLRFAGFELDFDRAELRAPQGEAIKLRPKTFALLHLLATNANRVLSKHELMTAIWPNVHVNDDSLFQCIREIRTALGDKDRRLVKSVSGRGYLFEADVKTGAADLPAPPPPSPKPLDAAPPSVPSAPLLAPHDDAPRPRTLRRGMVVGSLILCLAVGAAVAAATFWRGLAREQPPTIAVMPIETRTTDKTDAVMAADVAGRLTDGLSKIANIRVLAPRAAASVANETPARADLIVSGELRRGPANWEVQARLIDGRTQIVRWTRSVSVPADTIDPDVQKTRLAAAIGYPLALEINSFIHAPRSSTNARIVIEQANAFINSTSRERASAAQAMLEKALSERPDDVDLKAALASQLLRGIQTAWYSPAEAEEAERRARALLESALKREPGYVPALQGYCRLLAATNDFSNSLVACDRALSFEPWDGQALYQIGLSQLQLGRFEDALATFRQADRIDTPQLSRWTWLLGAGLTLTELGRYEEAVPWLERSLAITTGTGRTHMVLAATYQAMGRFEDAKKAMARGLELRPGSNVSNVPLPVKNQSERYRTRSAKIMELMVAAGLPDH